MGRLSRSVYGFIMCLWALQNEARKNSGIPLDPTILLLGAYDWFPYQQIPPFSSRWAGGTSASKSNISEWFFSCSFLLNKRHHEE